MEGGRGGGYQSALLTEAWTLIHSHNPITIIN